jgi:hypothetical protein
MHVGSPRQNSDENTIQTKQPQHAVHAVHEHMRQPELLVCVEQVVDSNCTSASQQLLVDAVHVVNECGPCCVPYTLRATPGNGIFVVTILDVSHAGSSLDRSGAVRTQ